MEKNLNTILELSNDDLFTSEIILNQVIEAKAIIKRLPKTSDELIRVLVSMNLINAALKRKEYKSKEKDAILHYGMLKPRVSRLLDYMLEIDLVNINCQFYIDASQHCAYVEIYNLQFSFHNISISENLQAFIDSDRNNAKPWKGIRLQKIAGELFDYYVIKKEA